MTREAEPGSDGGHDGAIVLLMDRDGRILLQQRSDDVPPAGYGRWQTIGGGRDPGETPREAALREFEEETGVRLTQLRVMRTAGRPEFPRKKKRDALFMADDPVAEDAIQVNEGLAMALWSPAEVAGLSLNPGARSVVDWFFASDFYRGTLEVLQPYKVGVCVIELDRWGRILLQLRDADLPPARSPDMWSLPGGHAHAGEPPDAAVLREFEEETGQLLETVKLFHVYRRGPEMPESRVNVQHVYYIDADIDEELISVNEGQAFRYFAPEELPALAIPSTTRRILDQFLVSAHYRGMFH